MIVERVGFVISLHIEMAHGAGLTSIYFCVVQLKSNNVLCSTVDFVFICCKKTKTHQHTHEYWPQCQPTNRWTNKLKVR